MKKGAGGGFAVRRTVSLGVRRQLGRPWGRTVLVRVLGVRGIVRYEGCARPRAHNFLERADALVAVVLGIGHHAAAQCARVVELVLARAPAAARSRWVVWWGGGGWRRGIMGGGYGMWRPRCAHSNYSNSRAEGKMHAAGIPGTPHLSNSRIGCAPGPSDCIPGLCPPRANGMVFAQALRCLSRRKMVELRGEATGAPLLQISSATFGEAAATGGDAY